jgi:hypothetical protein
MNTPNSLCDRLAQILRGMGQTENNICTVTIDRKELSATIGGKPFHSLHHMFHFEPADATGKALITGEMVLLENEVHRMTTDISNAGIIVSALHSHWLFDAPKLMYIHIETIADPVGFANTMAGILYK